MWAGGRDGVRRPGRVGRVLAGVVGRCRADNLNRACGEKRPHPRYLGTVRTRDAGLHG